MISATESDGRAARPVLSAFNDDPRAADLYRQVYVSLNLAPAKHPAVIGVLSSIRGEGRTTIALGLAQTLCADLDVPVSLVEVDLQQPSLAHHFGITAAAGLCDVLRGECQLEEVQCLVSENLTVITAGATGPDTARLLRQLPALDPFRRLPSHNRTAGVVILDLPPLLNSSYSSVASGVADATILVVRAGVTPLATVREAITRLEDRPPRGVIFNGARSALPGWWPGEDV